MIERALLPVQKQNIEHGISHGREPSGRQGVRSATMRRADIGAAATAVFKQEQSNLAEPTRCSVDDRAALTFANDQTRAGENGEMRRHGVLRHSHEAGEFPGRNAFGFFLDEQPEGIQPRRLGERREGGDGFRIIHISRL